MSQRQRTRREAVAGLLMAALCLGFAVLLGWLAEWAADR